MRTILRSIIAFSVIIVIAGNISCNNEAKSKKMNVNNDEAKDTNSFYLEQFGDLRILKYEIDGFDVLTVKQKELIYYLSQAGLCGRDILFDQNYKHNLTIKRTLETIYDTYTGDRDEKFDEFVVYLKRVWFSNGIHHHYSTDKFFPEISEEYFIKLIDASNINKLPINDGEQLAAFKERIIPVIFSKEVGVKRVCQNSDEDLVHSSAVNFYEGVSQEEVEELYDGMFDKRDDTPVWYGLNSKVVKKDGNIIEQVYRVGGMYSEAIEKIIFWLEKAVAVAENDEQGEWISKLIEYYQTGDLQVWDDFNVLWVKDTSSRIDMVNGFIEVYGDPLGRKATWEAVVNFKNKEASKRTEIISNNAQWFEDNSPADPRFKKPVVKGVSAKVITVAQLGGDCFPSTPIGINLPNSNWIRRVHGSKSVTIENITYAYDQASQGGGFLKEFAASETEIELSKKYGFISGNLHTDLHECLGHGSGQILPGVNSDALGNYHSPLEEARADLFALYYMLDPKLVELGLFPSLDAAKAEYNSYIRNGLLTQLTRIKPGANIEQAHMRCRKLITEWCYAMGKEENVIEYVKREGKTYVVVNNYEKLRGLFAELLKEVQRIKSEGDYEAGKVLVEEYGVKVDPVIHKEILERFEKLNIAPYSGFVNPVLVPIIENDNIVDIEVKYVNNYAKQMMDYAKDYSFLPNYN